VELAETPEGLSPYPSVQLFLERATAACPDFALTSDNAAPVAELCRRLDGLPLALELSAARVAILSPAEIVWRLDHRFELLRGGNRTAAARHQSLQAALDWSYELLSSSEQTVLRRLAVFSGTWTAQAAQQVCTDEEVDDELLDLLGGLVTKSLVVAERSATHTRFRLLETIRHYAWERLAAADKLHAVQHRHASWCLAQAEEAEHSLVGQHQQPWLEALDADHDNLRAALAYTTQHGQATLALRLASALVLFWVTRCHLHEGLDWLDRAIALSDGRLQGSKAAAALRAKALWGDGLLTALIGDFPAAHERAEESVNLAQQAGDVGAQARAVALQGSIALYAPTLASDVVATLEESRKLAQDAGDNWVTAQSLVGCGFAYLAQGAAERARPYFEECLQLAGGPDDEGLHSHRLHGLIGMARHALAHGGHTAADASLQEAVQIARALGHRFAETNALRLLGESALQRDDYETARLRLNTSHECGQGIQATLPTVYTLAALGRMALAERDAMTAQAFLDEADAIAEASGLEAGRAACLADLATAQSVLGNPAAARSRWGEALTRARACGEQPVVARCLYELGRLARADGANERAGALLAEAARTYQEVGSEAGVAVSLEALAGLMVERRPSSAARLLGAADALRCAHSRPEPRETHATYDHDVALLASTLSEADFRMLWAQGAERSVEDIVSYATRGRGPRDRPESGWDSVTAREYDVTRLAAEGLTNPQIGDRLFMSRRTVQSHLARVYKKLGVHTRQQLAHEFQQRKWVTDSD
jgi:DNA-binding CsgD family transcriptional regulator/tetratricopeptide (TPR) repeat protein